MKYKKRKLMSVLLSMAMLASTCLPASAAEAIQPEKEAACESVALITAADSDPQGNAWSLLSYSGRQSTPLKGIAGIKNATIEFPGNLATLKKESFP